MPMVLRQSFFWRLSAFDLAASERHHKDRRPGGVRSSRNRGPNSRCGIGGEISCPSRRSRSRCLAALSALVWLRRSSQTRRVGMRMGINSAGKCLRTLEPKLGVTPHPPSYLGHPLPKGEGCYFALSPASPGGLPAGSSPTPTTSAERIGRRTVCTTLH